MAGLDPIAGLRQDARYALRALRRSPLFAAVAIGSLALGLGANTVAFTLHDALFLQPVALPEPGRLVRVYGTDDRGARLPLFSYADYRDYRDRSIGAVELVALNKVAVAIGDAPPPAVLYDDYALPSGYRFAYGRIVSGNYFPAMGARVALGRALTPADDAPGRDPVVVLGHAFWRRQLGADPAIVGRTVVLQGVAFTVVGVASAGFAGTEPDVADFWVPLAARDLVVHGWWDRTWTSDRRAAVLTVLGRLRPGVSAARAGAVVDGVARQLAAADGRPGRAVAATLEPAGTRFARNAETAPAADAFLAAVWLVLLVACANVASLLLARSVERQKEIGIRLAIGASRARLVRQLVTESVLLCLAGGALGLVAADLLIRGVYPIALASLALPPGIADTLAVDLAPDLRVFLYTLALATGAGVLLGLVPALQSSRPNLTAVIRQQASMLGERLSTARLREGLVVAQVALSLVLLVAAGLLVRSLRAERSASPGYATRGAFAVAVGLRGPAADAEREARLRAAVVARLAETPGVLALSAAAKPPLSGQLPAVTLSAPESAAGASLAAASNRVAPGYFATMGLRLVRGRGFDASEARARAAVAVVSEHAAQRLWPGQDPLGRRFLVADGDAAPRAVEVVGVAADARSVAVWRRDRALVYLPAAADAAGMVLLVRTAAGSPGALPATADSLRRVAESVDAGAAAWVKAIDATVDYQLAPFRGLALAATALGALALALATAGIYGVMAYAVVRRLRDLALRAALGASPRAVLRVALARGARLVAAGVLVGAAAAAAGARVLRAVLVDVSPLDPAAFGGAALLVAAVATAAAVVPARRAVRVDPADVLRGE